MWSIARGRNLHLAARAGAILMTGCVPPPATSEPQRDGLAVDQVAGFWSLRAVGGTARCDLSLGNLMVDGARPALAERCGVEGVATARSWRATADGFELIGADGAVLVAFRPTGEDAFQSTDRRFILSRAPVS